MFGKFLKSRGVLLALLVMLIYGVLVFSIYFTGYRPLPNRVTDLPITLVNQDKQSSKLNTQLKRSLKSFKTVHESSNLDRSINQLKDRQTYLVIDIPANFSKRVQANQPAQLNFYVNEANQTMVVNSMENVATKVGNAVNNRVIISKGQAIMTTALVQQLRQQMNNLPVTAQAQQSQLVTAQVNKAYQRVNNSMTSNIHRVNRVRTGLNNSMAPFFISLATYLGALIGTIVLYGTYVKFAKLTDRFKSFAMLETVLLGLSLIGGAIVAGTVMAMTGAGTGHFAGIWLTHVLEIMGAYNLNLIFILLLGQIGAALNILLTMIQVVAGAGMVPVQLMGGFFKAIHAFSPMYYSIMSDYDLLYAQVSFTGLVSGAFILAIAYLLLNLIIVAFRRKQPFLHFEDLA